MKTCICTECAIFSHLASVRILTPHSFLTNSEGSPFVPPALWLCPMRIGMPFRGVPSSSLTSDPRYTKYLDWLHSPPEFPAISLNDPEQRSTPPITTAIGARVVMSDAQEVNASPDMRFFIDDQDSSNAILKISPHVNLPPIFLPVPVAPSSFSKRACLQIFFEIFSKDAHKIQKGHPKQLCDSIDRLSGCFGLTYHLRFPPNYPEHAPLVRFIKPHVSGGHVLSSGAVCCDVFLPQIWKARTSFEAAFRAVIILHCDDQPMTASSSSLYPSEKAAARDAWEFLVTTQYSH
jgi:hypothetical protein